MHVFQQTSKQQMMTFQSRDKNLQSPPENKNSLVVTAEHDQLTTESVTSVNRLVGSLCRRFCNNDEQQFLDAFSLVHACLSSLHEFLDSHDDAGQLEDAKVRIHNCLQLLSNTLFPLNRSEIVQAFLELWPGAGGDHPQAINNKYRPLYAWATTGGVAVKDNERLLTFVPDPTKGMVHEMKQIGQIIALHNSLTTPQVEAVYKWSDVPVCTIWNNMLISRLIRTPLTTAEGCPTGNRREQPANMCACLHVAMRDAMILASRIQQLHRRPTPCKRIPGFLAMAECEEFGYPCCHSAVCGAAVAVMKTFFPLEEKFFQGQAEEAKQSRLWAGLCFEQDVLAGYQMGIEVGRNTLALLLNRNSSTMMTSPRPVYDKNRRRNTPPVARLSERRKSSNRAGHRPVACPAISARTVDQQNVSELCSAPLYQTQPDRHRFPSIDRSQPVAQSDVVAGGGDSAVNRCWQCDTRKPQEMTPCRLPP